MSCSKKEQNKIKLPLSTKKSVTIPKKRKNRYKINYNNQHDTYNNSDILSATTDENTVPEYYQLLDTNNLLTAYNAYLIEFAPIESQAWFLTHYALKFPALTEEGYCCLSNMYMNIVETSDNITNIYSATTGMRDILLYCYNKTNTVEPAAESMFFHIYETLWSGFERFDSENAIKFRHNSIIQLMRASIFTDYGGDCAITIIGDYCNRINNLEIPVKYKVEARYDLAMSAVYHGLPDGGIEAIDGIFQDFTKDEINQFEAGMFDYLHKKRKMLLNKKTDMHKSQLHGESDTKPGEN